MLYKFSKVKTLSIPLKVEVNVQVYWIATLQMWTSTQIAQARPVLNGIPQCYLPPRTSIRTDLSRTWTYDVHLSPSYTAVIHCVLVLSHFTDSQGMDAWVELGRMERLRAEPSTSGSPFQHSNQYPNAPYCAVNCKIWQSVQLSNNKTAAHRHHPHIHDG
jgi:hypothetical protein